MARQPIDQRRPFLLQAGLGEDAPTDDYPFGLSAVRGLSTVKFGDVTILVGDNGTGKSTIVEAIAIASGFNAEGGSRNLQFATHGTHSELHKFLELRWSRRPSWGWFLRAETFYGMATHIATDDPMYGVGKMFPDLHSESHGESFLDLALSRFLRPGLYILDEPEAALSLQGQWKLLRIMHAAVATGAQFILATHSPALMALPEARLYELDDAGVRRAQYDDLAVVQLWRRFLDHPDSVLRHLLEDD
jgi:predicted ATPase